MSYQPRIALMLPVVTMLVCACESNYTTNERGIDRRNFDETVDACADFYQYANGAWMARNPIPGDRSRWSTGSELQERNFETLQRILEDAAANTAAPPGSIEQKVGDLYATAMDTTRIDAAGTSPVAQDLEHIAALSRVEEVQALITDYHRRGDFVLFTLGVFPDMARSEVNLTYVLQGGLGLPEKDYYLREDDESARIREQYVEHISNMFRLVGDDPESAQISAQAVMDMETRLAKVSLGAVEMRDPANLYDPTTPARADRITRNFDWGRYFAGLEVEHLDRFSFPHRNFFAEMDTMLSELPMSDWKSYLRWHVITRAAPFLSADFEEEDFRFFRTVLNGVEEMEPRWKRALRITDRMLGEVLGQLYVAEAFPPESKARALEMIDNMLATLRQRLENLEWMGDETKARAFQKLAAFTPKIGYPDKWRDYSEFAVDRDSYIDNVRRGSTFETRRDIRKIGQPVDRTEWGMSPPTVNAYYSPLQNEIVFPAGIMQPPFFDGTIDDAVNYGSMGAIIGHEILHGFDDQGSRFDAQGNFANWWTDNDRSEFMARARVLVEQFDDYVAVDDLHVNGQLTLGENIGDLGGLLVAYQALQRALGDGPREPIDGLTPEQRFFLAYAQSWRQNVRDEALKVQVQTDPHAPGKDRALGPVSNMPEFAEAFGCTAGDPMVRPDSVRVRIW